MRYYNIPSLTQHKTYIQTEPYISTNMHVDLVCMLINYLYIIGITFKYIVLHLASITNNVFMSL